MDPACLEKLGAVTLRHIKELRDQKKQLTNKSRTAARHPLPSNV